MGPVINTTAMHVFGTCTFSCILEYFTWIESQKWRFVAHVGWLGSERFLSVDELSTLEGGVELCLGAPVLLATHVRVQDSLERGQDIDHKYPSLRGCIWGSFPFARKKRRLKQELCEPGDSESLGTVGTCPLSLSLQPE